MLRLVMKTSKMNFINNRLTNYEFLRHEQCDPLFRKGRHGLVDRPNLPKKCDMKSVPFSHTFHVTLFCAKFLFIYICGGLVSPKFCSKKCDIKSVTLCFGKRYGGHTIRERLFYEYKNLEFRNRMDSQYINKFRK